MPWPWCPTPADSALCHHRHQPGPCGEHPLGRELRSWVAAMSPRDFVANTNAAGIYVASEGAPYFRESVADITVSGGSGAKRECGHRYRPVPCWCTQAMRAKIRTAMWRSPAWTSLIPRRRLNGTSLWSLAVAALKVFPSAGFTSVNQTCRFGVRCASGDYATSDWTLDGSPVDVAGWSRFRRCVRLAWPGSGTKLPAGQYG